MGVFPDAYITEMYLEDEWVDVTEDVLVSRPQKVSRGIRGSGPHERVAGTGTLRFSLRNDEENSAGLLGYYSPGHANCRAGFGPGVYVRMVIEFEEARYVKFYGRIPYGGIQVDPGRHATRLVHVEVRDYMEQAAIHELYLPEFTTEKRMDQIVALITQNMPTLPLATDLGQGSTIFNTVFDTVRAKTKAITEFQKVALSEMGYVYVRTDRENGEVLTVEGAAARPSKSELSSVNLITQGGFLLQENGDGLLQENGDGILLDAVVEIVGDFDNNIVDAKTLSGEQVYNIVRLVTYPRFMDSSSEVLFTLQNSLSIAAGATVKITGGYRDPSGNAKVSGIDMIAPVSTTDYLMNSQKDGTGSNLTANLTVTALYGTNSVEYTLTNGAGVQGFVTKLQARGTGVYIYDTVESIAQDEDSISDIGPRVLSIDMKYQDDPAEIEGLAEAILDVYKTPITAVKTITMCANRSEDLLRQFLGFDIGDRIRITEDMASPEARDYFINGVEFELLNRVIFFTWHVKPAVLDFAE